MDYDLNFLKCGVAGGLAGLSVDAIYYPIDTIKTRIMGSSIKENLTKTASNISKFRGFSCQLIISFPYSFTFFLIYQGIRDRLPQNYATNLIAAVCGQTVANFLKNPLELVKQQMMVGRSNKALTSLKQVYSTLGIRGFYMGYSPALIRDILFSALQMPLYEYLKKPIAKLLDKNTTSPLVSATAGSLAGTISAILTCPLDVIKTRHMTIKLNEVQQNGLTSSKVAQIIYNEQGLKGFFRGVWLRAGLLASGGIIYFSALSYWKNFLQVKG